MTPASSVANGGAAFSQTGPDAVGSRNRPARFQVRRCSTGPVTGRPAAARASDAQASSSFSPSIRAHGDRSSCGTVSSAGSTAQGTKPRTGRSSASTW